MSASPGLDVRDERLLPTRRSLLDRLRDWEDQASWRDFFNTYWKFVYGVAIRSGLSDQEAEDVVRETVLSVVKKMPEFVYHPARCSFKGWLMHVTRLRIVDQLRRRQPAFQQSSACDEVRRIISESNVRREMSHHFPKRVGNNGGRVALQPAAVSGGQTAHGLAGVPLPGVAAGFVSHPASPGDGPPWPRF